MAEEKKKQGTGLAVAVIALSLVAAAVLMASPPIIQRWCLSLGTVVVSLAAGIKFAVLCMDSFRMKNRLLGLLWGILSALFILLLVADLRKVVDLAQ